MAVKTYANWYSLSAMLVLILFCSTNVLAAEKQTEQIKKQANETSLGETPGTDYVQLIRQWADVTNFAKNAADMTVNRLTHDLEKDPKYKKFITPNLISELKQFFYELYSSQENMINLSKVYAQYFTLDDMLEMINFYNSPLGQKMIQSNEALANKSHEIGSELLKKHEQDYMRIIAKYIKQPGTDPVKK